MDELAMCRICLADDVRMRLIANTHLQEMYESMTLIQLETKDSRPAQVCYICCAELENCYRLRKRCHQSEEVLTRALSSGVLQPVSSCKQRLTVVHPVINMSIYDEVDLNDSDEETGTEAPQAEDNQKQFKVEVELTKDIKNEDQTELDAETDDNIQCSHLEDPLNTMKRELVDVETGTAVLKKHRQATQRISIETTSSELNRNKHAEVKAEPKNVDNYIVIDVPIVLSKTHETVDKVDSTLDEHRDNKVTTAHDEVHKQMSQSNICLNKKGFRSKAHLKCDTRTRAGEKQFECDVCKKCVRHKSLLIRHIHTHTGEKPFSCDLCKKSFRRKYHLKCHMRTHTGEKPYMCDVCMKGFSDLFSFKRHLRTHTGYKPYVCDVCKKYFSNHSNLKTHMRTHTGEKPFTCDVCKKCYTQKSQLQRHSRIHTGEKPYMCDVCMKCFSEHGNLKVHMRIHTIEKSFICDVCKKSFSHNLQLKRHMRTHTGEKPYMCNVCKKCFYEHGHLKTHMRTHTGEKPYMCDVCTKCFSEHSNLKTHMRTHSSGKDSFFLTSA